MNITIGHTTHSGIKRDHNEDTYGVNNPKHVYLVADGMGGHDHGEIASALARDNILSAIEQGMDLETAILTANQEIINSSSEKPGDLPMGTTVIIVKLDQNDYHCAWVGDSRAYIYQNKSLTAISSDHSYVQELVDQKLISTEQARSHPHRNVVTQALGVTDNSEIKVASKNASFEKGDKFLLCSDGLTEEVDDMAIEAIMSQNAHPKELADQLLIKALENGGSDNITVLVIEIN
ncbi:PP2C family protein-serine/threonine phosphatase [Marinicella rhabdoformis]|uniref:PP2C family protein-serine/threonine phosphatase n=1 Tax=Marinicella rhabdoformis TaxID=2580566 RepID=UPI0012AED35B|nr:SpoIIE family protein phosphatase [Marinicella rhabdoformis]